MSADTSPTVVAAALAAKNGTTPPPASEVMTPAKGKAPKAPKAPKASPPSAIKSKVASQLTYEPGIATLKLSEIDMDPATNTTRPEWAVEVTKEKALAENLEEIKAQLQAVGQTTPIVVQRVKGGKKAYRLAAGYRRTAALAQLGKDTVEARIEASGTDEARIMVNITENENARKSTTVLGKLAAVEALAAFGHDVKEVTARIGHAEDVVRDLMRLNKCSPELRAAITAPEGSDEYIAFSVGRQLARKPVEEQPKLLKACKDLSTEATRSYLAELASDSKGTSSKKSGEKGGSEDDSDPVYPEARVVKATVPFIVRLAEAQDLMNAAMAALEKAIEVTGLKIPPMVDAVKVLEQAQSAYGKTGNVMVTAVSNLLGEKEYTAHLKAAIKASKEA